MAPPSPPLEKIGLYAYAPHSTLTAAAEASTGIARFDPTKYLQPP